MNRNYEFVAKNACDAYKGADKSRWVAAYWCSGIVGYYERGATLSLANQMGVSVDTVENLAHAYSLYNELRSYREYEFSKIVAVARRHPRVYMNHFIALYKARETYGLSNEQIISLLVDIVQANGQLSSRDVDNHVQSRYGKERPWYFYAQRAQKEITKALMCPDLPGAARKVLQSVYEVIGDQA